MKLNRAEFFPDVLIGTARQQERRDSRFRLVCRGLSATALAVGLIGGSVEQLPVDGSGEGVAANDFVRGEKADPHSFDRMTVISLDDPTDAMPAESSTDKLANIFEKATESIEETTDGWLEAPERINVVRVERAPSGMKPLDEGDGAYEEYYTSAALDDIRKNVLREHDLNTSVRTPIVIESDVVSEAFYGMPEGATAYFDHYKQEGGVYLRDAMRKPKFSSFSSNIAGHELSHKWLSHNGSITRGGKLGVLILGGAQDLGTQVEEGVYRYQSDADSHVDEYAGRSSIMGNITSQKKNELFNFVEINRINHDVAPIERVTAGAEKTVEIGVVPGTIRGVQFDVPYSHPLRTTRENVDMKTISVGLGAQQGDEMSEIQIIGQAEGGMTYEIATTSYIPRFDAERGPVDVFKDAEIGIKITAETSDKQAEDGTRTTLHISSYQQENPAIILR